MANETADNGTPKKAPTKKDFLAAWKFYSEAESKIEAAKLEREEAVKALHDMLGTATFTVGGESYKVAKVAGKKKEGAPDRYTVKPLREKISFAF